MATDDLFKNFVNKELPKRVSSDENPLAVPKGRLPVTTGVGLGVEFLDPDLIKTGLNVELITVKDIPYVDGAGVLPALPIGDFIFNTARLKRTDDSIIEVDGIRLVVEPTGRILVQLDPQDHLDYGVDIVSITVSYITAIVDAVAVD